MVDFAGFLMPVVYEGLTPTVSHNHTRTKASIFDVSHMLQTKVHGKDKEAFMEALVVGDIKGLGRNSGTLSLFTNENGGIMDDVIVSTTSEDYLYVVSNAGCSEKIQAHFQEKLKEHSHLDVTVEHMNNGLIAFQGPAAAKVLATGAPDIDMEGMFFMNNKLTSVFGIGNCRVSRCGYTGEDGFEISVPHEKTVELAEKLLEHEDVELAGLGARDSLRLEAGLCLYGNDMDETTTPPEASLTWTIGKSRRKEANFPGAEKILQMIKDKPAARRVGLLVEKGIARQGAIVEDKDGNEIGRVTSGCPAPSIGKNVAMAYLPRQKCKAGTEVFVRVRKRLLPAKVSRMPFTPAQYYFGK